MDPVHFTGREVLEMALRIEENGVGYYTAAARASRSRDVKALFKFLAAEEGEHIKVFRGLTELTPDYEVPVVVDPYTEEASMYLYAIADTKVFTAPGEGKRLALRTRSERQALSVAIGTEKDSILFYYELLKMINERDRAVVERLIEQEKEHLRKLSEALKDLSARKRRG
jgi:rubrerythrin